MQRMADLRSTQNCPPLSLSEPPWRRSKLCYLQLGWTLVLTCSA